MDPRLGQFHPSGKIDARRAGCPAWVRRLARQAPLWYAGAMSATAPGGRREYLLFVYDAWMSGMPGATRLAGARPLGAATTAPQFDLVDLGAEVALVPGGTTAVRGELYALEPATLAPLDVEKGHPLRFKRIRIQLEDGRDVDAYTLDADQVRGRRRIRSGDLRAHQTPAAPERAGSAWSKWAKGRASGR
jgi:gamma-glutamylcyclotransferase (GGCT)/AIG2-like uncharacterized protein YtfP